MLEKLSGIKELKDKVDDVDRRLSSLEEKQSKASEAIINSISKINDSVTELKGMKEGYVNKFTDDLGKISNLQREFEKALRTFQQDHIRLYETVSNKANSEINDKLLPLKNVVNDLEKIKPQAKEIIAGIAKVNESMNKLNSVASSIRKEDFELKHFAQELLKMDTEKIRLVQQIETMKKIISRERRNR